MKFKVLVLILLVLFVSACQSETQKAVQSKINSLEVYAQIDSDTIAEVRQAYNQLSEKDQKKIEYLVIRPSRISLGS